MVRLETHSTAMDSKWTCKDLRRSKTDVGLNTLLFIFLVISYVPQISLILSRRSTSGITQTYLLSGYLFTATQFALMMVYASWHFPIIPCLIDQGLKGVDAWGAVVVVVQDTVLWLGSATLILLFVLFPNENINTHTDDLTPISAARHSVDRYRYPKTILSLCLIHFSLWVLPLLVIAIPRPREPWIYEGGGYFIGFAFWLLVPTCMVLVVSQFPLQLRTILSSRNEIGKSSLSLATLAMQAIAFILLGISWKTRLGKPGDPFNTDPPYRTPKDQYRFGGWLFVNNIIFGVGQGVLLLASLWVSRHRLIKDHSIWVADERISLLRGD